MSHEIRKCDKDIVIIAVTAFAMKGDREKAIAAGCNDHVTKPVNMKRLANIISSYFPESVARK